MKSILCRYKGSYLSYILTSFFYFFSMAMFSSVLSVYLTGIGKTATEMSFIVSASGIFSFGMVPFIGFLNDKTRKPKVISSILLVCVGLLGFLFAVSRAVWLLFLLNGLIMSCINSLMPICERMSGASKYRYGSIRVWGTLGFATAAQVAGIILESVSPFLIFVFLFISSLLTIVGFWGTEDNMAPAPAKNKTAEEKPRLLSFIKNPSFLLFLLIAFLFAGSSGVNMTYVPVLLTNMGLPTGNVGTVLFFSTVIEIPLILFSNKFMDRFSGKSLLIISFSIMITQFLCYAFLQSTALVVTAVILLKAIASTMFVMITLKIVRNVVHAAFTTTALSIVNSINSLGTILLQNLGGIVVDLSNIHILYLCLTVTALAGLIFSLFLRVQNSEKVFDT